MSIRDALEQAAPRPSPDDPQGDKKNYAERLSNALASAFANALRPNFEGIMPFEDGRRRESMARTSKGFKKLDVNFSTPELGLGLGVSIKTLNFPDARSGRYTKNFTRIDDELRAEAVDYHRRQPFSVLVAVIFLPLDSATDSDRGPSSFGQAVRVFRHRADRRDHQNEAELFERIFMALYRPDDDGGEPDAVFFDVMTAPPRNGVPRPEDLLSFDDVIEEIRRAFDDRNDVRFEWAD